MPSEPVDRLLTIPPSVAKTTDEESYLPLPPLPDENLNKPEEYLTLVSSAKSDIPSPSKNKPNQDTRKLFGLGYRCQSCGQELLVSKRSQIGEDDSSPLEVKITDDGMFFRRHIELEAVSILSPSQAQFYHSTKALRTIYGVLQTCNRIPDHEPLLEDLLKSLFQAVHADRGAVFLHHQGSNHYVGQTFIGEKGDRGEFPISQTILKDVMENGVSLISTDPRADIRYRTSESLRMQKVRSFICAPLISYEKVFGIVYLDRIQLKSEPFIMDELELVAAIGILVGTTLEKSLLLARQKASLAEKEVLLKEIHHRVKNNLQIISSLLSLQSRYIQDQNTLAALQESRDRVQTIGFIHESLCRSPNLAQIDFAEYIHKLVNNLCRSYKIHLGTIKIDIDIIPVHLTLDAAIPCGLIINELVSNSFKHAFPSGQSGTIHICLARATNLQLKLVVGDNGVGLPPNFDFLTTTSLGLKLVKNLAEQLQGILELKSPPGTEFKLIFKL